MDSNEIVIDDEVARTNAKAFYDDMIRRQRGEALALVTWNVLHWRYGVMNGNKEVFNAEGRAFLDSKRDMWHLPETWAEIRGILKSPELMEKYLVDENMRRSAIAETLANAKADVYFLQEVTKNDCALIADYICYPLTYYFCPYEPGKEVGIAIFYNRDKTTFPSTLRSNGRACMYVVDERKRMVLANVHLKGFGEDDEKGKQANRDELAFYLGEISKEYPEYAIVFAGDFNSEETYKWLGEYARSPVPTSWSSQSTSYVTKPIWIDRFLVYPPYVPPDVDRNLEVVMESKIHSDHAALKVLIK